MSDLPPVGARLELEIDRYNRNMADAIRGAGRLDGALAGIVSSANRMETSINAINADVNFAATVDDADIQSAVNLRDMLDDNTSMIADVDDSEIDKAKRTLDDFDGTSTHRVNVNDAEVDTTNRKINDFDGSSTHRVNVNDSELEDVESTLNRLEEMSPIDLAFEVSGAATGFIETVATMTGVPGLIEMDEALGRIQAKTGVMIPDAETLIVDLYTSAWGDSRTAIADVIVAAEQLGITGEEQAEVIEQAFGIASVTGSTTEEVLRAQAQMVRNDLTSSYTDAGDALITIFQNTGDPAEDLLDTFIEYSSTFNEMNFDVEEATAAMVSGVRGGVENYDRVGDALREFGILVKGDTDEVNEALAEVGMLSEAEAFRNGEMSGGVFVDGVMKAVSQIDDPQQQMEILTSLFGTFAEDLGVEALLSIQPLTTEIEVMAGVANEAASAMNDNLGTAFEGLRRHIEVELGNAMNEIFDVDQMIDDLKTAVSTFFDELESGNNIFGSIEIAFGLDGFEEFVQGIRRGLTDLSIGFLEFIADIKSFLGRDTSGEEANIARLGAFAFEADLFEADAAEDIESAIVRAIERGVDRETISAAANELFESSLANADIETAEMIVEGVEGVRNYHLAVEDASGAVSEFSGEVKDHIDEQLEAGVSTAELAASTELLNEDLLDTAISLDDANEALRNLDLIETGQDFLAFGNNVNTTRDEVNTSLGSMSETAGATSEQIDGALTRLYQGEDAPFRGFVTGLTEVVTTGSVDLGAIAAAAESMGTRAGAAFSRARIEALGLGDELRTIAELAASAIQVLGGIQQGSLGAVIGGISSGLGAAGIGGGGSTTNINQTNNIVNQNGSQATATAQTTSAAIRGFSP